MPSGIPPGMAAQTARFASDPSACGWNASRSPVSESATSNSPLGRMLMPFGNEISRVAMDARPSGATCTSGLGSPALLGSAKRLKSTAPT